MLSMYHNLSNACYKLLFYIGITNMLVMLMNGFETGNRTWLLCIVPTVYAIILSLYTPPILFSSLYMSWFFNPYVGYVDDFGKIYHSPMHTLFLFYLFFRSSGFGIHDMFVIFGLSAIYITFSVLLIIQTQSYNAHYQATLAQKLVEFTIH
ncbi:hypothetical protein niasHT_001012 [Heterodera trifolii]|uniref:NADH dehydrogenase subunit 6 n=1 Tax=Heterodera trifolii TaxID=157864 RepID=A0ABD2LTB4_9BILA